MWGNIRDSIRVHGKWAKGGIREGEVCIVQGQGVIEGRKEAEGYRGRGGRV